MFIDKTKKFLVLLCLLWIGCGQETTDTPSDGGTVGLNILSQKSISGNIKRPIDIVWVIDNSGSPMDEYQEALAEHFSSFLEPLVVSDVDFKMAVITTDSFINIIGNDLLTLKRAKMNKEEVINKFSQHIQVGVFGGRDQGLSVVDSFLRSDSDWMRDRAYLVIIYVSKDDDLSSSSVKTFLDYWKSLKENPAHVRAYSLVDLNNSIRYIELAYQTTGLVEDITKKFNSTLTKWGEIIVKLSDSYAFEKRPKKIEEIEVYSHDVLVPQKYWIYDNDSNSIKFLNGFSVDKRETIQVKYSKED